LVTGPQAVAAIAGAKGGDAGLVTGPWVAAVTVAGAEGGDASLVTGP
jgi:hypothetical protein